MRIILKKRPSAGGTGDPTRVPVHRAEPGPDRLPRLVIVGNPNVGKSVAFNLLTGLYTTVSNYPGTSVTVCRGRGKVTGSTPWDVTDTPGMYSLTPITEEERITRRILVEDAPDVVLHIADATNIERTLPLTLQLIEAELPVILALNMMDEAERAGIQVDPGRLEAELGIPVVGTVMTTGRGLEELRKRIEEVCRDRAAQGTLPAGSAQLRCCAHACPGAPAGAGCPPRGGHYSPRVEQAASSLEAALRGQYALSKRSTALLLLEEDPEIADLVRRHEGINFRQIEAIIQGAKDIRRHSLSYQINIDRRSRARAFVRGAVRLPESIAIDFAERLSRWCLNPWTGLPTLLVMLYVGLYWIVGWFGAGWLVERIEGDFFGRIVNPALTRAFEAVIPWPFLRDLFVGEDVGIFTLGITYAVSIVLPIVFTFFLVLSILEDTGYLPRMAMLVDRAFKAIGLSGRAVIPMTLGFGCDTMATLVTRILETRRERIIASFLLALCIPCAAQLGVITAIAAREGVLLPLAGVLLATFFLAGWATARVLPGDGPSFYMEIPRMRLPKIGNVLAKTFSRILWYLREILPLFIYASVAIWAGKVTGVFERIIEAGRPVMHALGLPGEAARTFILGFFRRDYGAAELHTFTSENPAGLTPKQVLIGCAVLTLFIPCIANFMVLWKERGWRVAVPMAAVISVLAFGVGAILNIVVPESP